MFVSLALLCAGSQAFADDEQEESAEAKDVEHEARRPTGRFELGAGYNPDEAFVATAGVYQDDLFGTGIALSALERLSARRQRFLMRVTDPDLLGTGLTLTADIDAKRERWIGFTREGVGGGLTATAPISPYTRLFLGYRLERVSLNAESDSAGPAVLDEAPGPPKTLSAVRAGIAHDTRDNPMFPTTGSTLGLSLEVADERLGSDIQTARLRGYASRHGRLAGPLSLHTRVFAEGVWNQSGGDVPLTERIQFGGHRDVRGYGIGSVSPLGGDLEVTSQTELELTLSQEYGLSAIAFFDAGGVWDLDGQSCQVALSASSPVDPCAGRSAINGLRESVGFGLLWKSPIGPLRFDWAFPLDRKAGGSGWAFLFSLGGTF